jgi:hypothetical protein
MSRTAGGGFSFDANDPPNPLVYFETRGRVCLLKTAGPEGFITVVSETAAGAEVRRTLARTLSFSAMR